MSHFINRPILCEYIDMYFAVPEGTDLSLLEPPPGADDDDDYEFEAPDGCVELSNDLDEACRMLAAMEHWNEHEEAPDVRVDGRSVRWGDRVEFLVLTDSEADEMWDEYLDQYIEDNILYQLPQGLRGYFDSESWKKDARMDGRGHCLSSYDGNEHDVEINDETYYLYRV